jgi:uncharacterized damage-inducible protein DinB
VRGAPFGRPKAELNKFKEFSCGLLFTVPQQPRGFKLLRALAAGSARRGIPSPNRLATPVALPDFAPGLPEDFGKLPVMLTMLQDLVRHQGYANAALLRAVRSYEKAAKDEELRKLLHHIILANRFWLMLICGRAFALDHESQVPESLEILVNRYQETHVQELGWISQLQEADLARRVETPFIPGCTFSIAEAYMQVVMHSHGHRSQCAARLRLMGGKPPGLDFILWLKDRPHADWT